MKAMSPEILAYIELVTSGKVAACKDQQALVKLVINAFEHDDIYTNEKQLRQYLSLSRFFPYPKVFEWQKFFLALHLCTYRKSDGMPRWPDALALIGRGAGKDGTIANESMMLTSPANGIREYNVDICANNEEQAKRPFFDLWDVLEDPRYTKTLKQHYTWNREMARNIATKSEIKGRTNSPKGKDGLRSGAVVFNEIHQYENYDNINVFTTGLGKKPHPRRTYYTTNGDVRGGPLDDLIATSEGILHGGEPDNGFLPFLCRLDNKEQVHNPDNWVMANPSLLYLPSLMEETKKEYAEWKRNPHQLPAFMTKRMNLPQSKNDVVVTAWDNIAATNKTLPDLTGWECTVGIDYAKVTDFASVNFHFRKGDRRFDINHSWLCTKSSDFDRLKCPWREWADRDLLTVVDDVEIPPATLCKYILKMGQKYIIQGVALDNFRFTLFSRDLEIIGFDAKTRKNVKLVQPSDIMKTSSVIDSCFAKRNFTWGDNPVLRWATNNTKCIPSSSKAKIHAGADTGNYVYAKIEPHTRKTDPFMALVASMVIENELTGCGMPGIPDFGIITF